MTQERVMASRKRLILSGATFGAVAGLFFLTATGDAIDPPFDAVLLLLGAMALGVGCATLATLQAFVLLRKHYVAWTAWPMGALRGGLIYFLGAWAALGSLAWGALLASIWALGWLCFAGVSRA